MKFRSRRRASALVTASARRVVTRSAAARTIATLLRSLPTAASKVVSSVVATAWVACSNALALTLHLRRWMTNMVLVHLLEFIMEREGLEPSTPAL